MKIKYITINERTQGAAETVALGLKTLSLEELNRKFISIDCDTFYTQNILELCRVSLYPAIIYFTDLEERPIYSYIRFDNDNNFITEIIEKVKITNNANTGCYMFISGSQFLYIYDKIKNEINEVNELYISSIYKKMLDDNILIKGIHIDINAFHCLGTPFQIKLFSTDANFQTKKYRFCFDLDETLVTNPQKKGDYSTVKPIPNHIRMCNFLKNKGHTIIIYTARRMRTHGGNMGQVVKDIGQVTFDTLDRFNINYDEIYFGKPYADFYFDDKSINLNENWEKATGFYNMAIDERDFNEITENKIDTIIKRSQYSKLKGEIYWYTHIPKCIQDLFPILVNSSKIPLRKWKK